MFSLPTLLQPHYPTCIPLSSCCSTHIMRCLLQILPYLLGLPATQDPYNADCCWVTSSTSCLLLLFCLNPAVQSAALYILLLLFMLMLLLLCVNNKGFMYVCCCCAYHAGTISPALASCHGVCPAAYTQHSVRVLLWQVFLRCVCFTLRRLLGRFMPAAAVAVCTMQAPCYDNGAIPTRAGLQGVSNTSPARGRPVANSPAVPLPRVRVYR